MKTKLIATIACLLLAAGIQAQQMTPEQERMMYERAKERVKMMNNYISMLASKKVKKNMKPLYYKYCLDLFIEQGQPYDETIIDRRTGQEVKTGRNTGVKMQTTSKRNPQPRTELMRNYLTRIQDYKQYKEVTITSTEVNIRFSGLQKVGEGHYVCTAYFDQVFIGVRNGEGAGEYKDVTRKKVECHIVLDDTIDGVEYITLLGNVYAVSTK